MAVPLNQRRVSAFKYNPNQLERNMKRQMSYRESLRNFSPGKGFRAAKWRESSQSNGDISAAVDVTFAPDFVKSASAVKQVPLYEPSALYRVRRET